MYFPDQVRINITPVSVMPINMAIQEKYSLVRETSIVKEPWIIVDKFC